MTEKEFISQALEFYKKHPERRNNGYLVDDCNFFAKFLTRIPTNITREKKSEIEGLSFVSIFERFSTNIVGDIKDFSNKFIQAVEYLTINDYFWTENELNQNGVIQKKFIELNYIEHNQ